MKTITIPTNEGPREVELIQKFSHYVDNVRFWFAVHRPPHAGPVVVLSHWDSKLRICELPAGYSSALNRRQDWRDTGREYLDRLANQVGARKLANALLSQEVAA